MMKTRYSVLALVAVSVLTLSGCGTSHGEYLTHVRDQGVSTETASDAELLALGDEACESFDMYGAEYIVQMGALAAMSDTEENALLLASVISGAAKYLCTEHEAELETALQN